MNLLKNCITNIDTLLTNNSLSLNFLKTESLHIKIHTTIFLPSQFNINILSICHDNKYKILIDITTISHSD